MASGWFWCAFKLAESRAQLSQAATQEETSQLEVDAAMGDVSSERELSAANARRGVATDALRVEADGAHHRAEAADEVTESDLSDSPSAPSSKLTAVVRRSLRRKRIYYLQRRRNRKSE